MLTRLNSAQRMRFMARLRLLKRIGADRKGVAAIEFAFVFPVFLILFFGVVEYSKFNMETRRAEMAVDFAADYLSRDGDGMLQTTERHVVEDIWMIMNPTGYLATQLSDGGWASGYSRAFASVRFKKKNGNCAKNCKFEPEVAWSFLFEDVVKNPIYIHCDLDVVSNSTALDGTNIREGAMGRTPVVIVDFTYPYKPLLEGWLLPSADFHVNAVKKTRNGAELGHASDSFVTRCN